MNTLNSDTFQSILHFLTAKETANLAQTSSVQRNECVKNMCIIVDEHICWGNVKPGMTWEKQEQTRGQRPGYQVHYASTIKSAESMVKELQKKPKVFAVKVGFLKDFRNLHWSNYSVGLNLRKIGKWFYSWQC